MFEYRAIKAIREGKVEIDQKLYKIEKHPKGHCDGCIFDVLIEGKRQKCPAKAINICCSGGYILKEFDNEETR